MPLERAWAVLKTDEGFHAGSDSYHAYQDAMEDARRAESEKTRIEYHAVPCPRCGAGEEQPCTGAPYGVRRAQHNTHKERELAVGQKRMDDSRTEG